MLMWLHGIRKKIKSVVIRQSGRSSLQTIMEVAMNYDCRRVTLLVTYDFTVNGEHERFREGKCENHECPRQFIFRLKNYFTYWVGLAICLRAIDRSVIPNEPLDVAQQIFGPVSL